MRAYHPSHCPQDDTALFDTTSSIEEGSTVRERVEKQLTLVGVVDANKLRRDILQWLIQSQQPFSEVERPSFRQLIINLNPGAAKYLPSSDTVRTWTQLEINHAVGQVKRQLQAAKSKIHISFDVWTSPFNSFALCGVVAHFVNKEWRNQQVLLAMKRLYGTHHGEDIAEVIVPVLKVYGISAEMLGVFVGDNASNNDTCVRSILDEFEIYDPVEKRRSRCLGHIINIVAEAFLFGDEVAAFQEICDTVDDSTPFHSAKMQAAQIEWRKRGVIGKLHNIIVFIRSSPQRRETFRSIMVGEKDVDGKLLLVVLVRIVKW
jgi:hypothetical protein